MYLKLPFSLLLFLPAFSPAGKPPAAAPAPTVSAQIIGWKKEKPAWANQLRNVLLIRVVLQNNSPDTIRYLSMTCDWQDLYDTNVKAIGMQATECNKNISELLDILPHKQRQVVLRLVSGKENKIIHGLKFKIGFHYIPVKNAERSLFYYEDTFLYPDKPIKRNMLWSNELHLK